MKNIIILLVFINIVINTKAQSSLDKSIQEISEDIANKLKLISKKKLVVLYITDINKQQTIAGKYIADLISYNLVNYAYNFEIFDRDNLQEISEAKNLMSEGYISAASAKELGKILAVETIIIGNYTILSQTLKLTLKALDVNNGFVIAASMKDLPLNADAGAILGINISASEGNNNVASRGFNNKPLNSNEVYNNPETVNNKCRDNNTGDYCFSNLTPIRLRVNLRAISSSIYSTTHSLTLESKQTQCLYDISVGPTIYSYKEEVGNSNHSYMTVGSGASVTPSNKYNTKPIKVYAGEGQIYIEKCK